MRAAYILFIYLFVFFCFVVWGGGGGELDSSLLPFLGFDGLLEEEALLCLLFLPTLCHDDSLSPSSIDSSLLLESTGFTVSFCVAPAVAGVVLLVFSSIAAGFVFCFVWCFFSCKCSFVVLTHVLLVSGVSF